MDAKILAACLDLAEKNTDRSFFCKDNKFDLVMRESSGKTFLYMPISSGKKYLYVLNSSLNDIREDEIIVKGKFSRIGDLGLRREMNVPFKSEQGVATIPLRLAPAEGTLLVLY